MTTAANAATLPITLELRTGAPCSAFRVSAGAGSAPAANRKSTLARGLLGCQFGTDAGKFPVFDRSIRGSSWGRFGDTRGGARTRKRLRAALFKSADFASLST